MAAQTVNMGSTYVASQNVRYANEGGTGTTLNKLAKLTGAPSTAIITATTDTSGILGIVVAGAGAAGSADIAVAGKASCVFDSATTAGHYVVNDTSTAGDCMDAGAAYPASGQVIGVVTSTNGGAGTYEVDLSFSQPQSGGGLHGIGCSWDGGGSALTTGLPCYTTIPYACTLTAWNILVDTGTTTIKTWKIATGTAIPTVANSISTAGVAIAANTAVRSTVLADFTSTAFAAHDIFGFNIEAVATATKITFVLECQ
jgi:hypothetical protein